MVVQMAIGGGGGGVIQLAGSRDLWPLQFVGK